MVRVVYRIIWTVIYFLSLLALFVKRLKEYFRHKLFKLKNSEIGEDLDIISAAMKGMSKIPSHIVLILGNETISFHDLANVIIWCMAAGVSFISLYDYSGILKKNEDSLRSVVIGMNKKYTENIQWGRMSHTHGVINGIRNGFTSSQKIVVNIFSLSDGKESIVDVAKELSQSVLEKKLQVSDISRDLINKRVQEYTGVPDPDVAVYCGPVCCPYGLLPWQIRLTEFVQLHSHHDISVMDFIKVLYVYNKCEQRFGK